MRGLVTVTHHGRDYNFPVRPVTGHSNIDGDTLLWTTSEDPGKLVEEFRRAGGIIYVDVACDYLRDQNNQPVAGSALRLIGSDPPFAPGGIFRAWIALGQ